MVIIPTLIAFFGGAPFVPTPMRAIRKILTHLNPKPNTTIYDIGCGDGRFIHEANIKYHTKGVGFELSLPVFLLAFLRKWITGSKAQVIFGNFRSHSLHNADIVYCYMLPATLKKFVPKFLKDLKPGTLVVSYAFHIDDWKPLETIPRDPEKAIATTWIYEIGKI